ncbi:hypothetical protein QJQ45_022767 [Haematococcus lacustris]|nr:hypothetical protein QJQ45_022767 [Haematococcus lacustris]
MRCYTHTRAPATGYQRRITVTASLSPIARKAQKQAANQRRQQDSKSHLGSQAQALQQSSPSGNYDILEAFFYGRALAITLSRRLSEVVVEVVSEISKAAAERPQRVREFQEEVATLARQEMASASLPSRSTGLAASGSGSTSSSSSSGSLGGQLGQQAAGGGAPSSPEELQVVVDDLRAEIAYSRAILQQMRAGSKGAGAGTSSIA